MSDKHMKLSVVIPIYNVEKYVAHCLDSVLNERTAGLPFEVIVVNDGTQDHSMKVVRTYCSWPNLHIIEQANGGLSRARNAGLRVAQGEYVWFLDSDDWTDNDAVLRILQAIDSHRADLIASGICWEYGDTTLARYDMTFAHDEIIGNRDYFDRHLIVWAIQRFVIRRGLLLEYGLEFYPGIVHEDNLFGTQVVYAARSILLLSHPYYHYRQREEGSIMKSITIRSAYDMLTIHRELVCYGSTKVRPEDRRWFRKEAFSTLIDTLCIAKREAKSDELQLFMQRFRPYLQKECCYCCRSYGLKMFVKCMWLKYFPLLFIRVFRKVR